MDEQHIIKQFEKKTRDLAQATGVDIPANDFLVGIHNCWSCTREHLVFSWENHSDEEDTKPRGNVIPSTVKEQYSMTAGESYWGNSCPHCGKLQGDHYLYSEPDGPFFPVSWEFTDLKPEELQIKVATYAYELGLI